MQFRTGAIVLTMVAWTVSTGVEPSLASVSIGRLFGHAPAALIPDMRDPGQISSGLEVQRCQGCYSGGISQLRGVQRFL